MKNEFLCAIVISMIAMTLSGCSTMSYTPSISLDKSPITIEAKVQFDGLDDKTPEDDHKIRVLGFSATHKNTLSGNLSTDVSNAILNDFQNNQVFSEISKRINNPDYIINGSIHRFTGTTGIIWYTIPVDPLWFVGLPCCTEDGVITISVIG